MSHRELDPWIEGYLSYLSDVQRKRPRTVIDVRCTLKKLRVFMSAAHPEKPVCKVTLDEYVLWLSELRGLGRSASAMAKDTSHIRGFLEYSWRSGRCDRNVLDGFSLQDSLKKTVSRSLTLEEAEALIRACGREISDARRTRLVTFLLYGCGLRTSELCGLDIEDVYRERQELFIKRGKGGAQRLIPVPSAVWTELLAYLLECGKKRGALLRTLVKKRRISPKDVGDIVKRVSVSAGLSGKVTARTLRHTFGTHLMDRGVDVAVISSLMGHKSPNETGVYLHVLPGRGEAAVKKLVQKEEAER